MRRAGALVLARIVRAGTVLAFALPVCVGAAAAPAPDARWTPTVSVAVRGTYDSNVWMQDDAPDAAVAGAARASVASWVTTASANCELRHKLTPRIALVASYVPEVTRFHSAESENHALQRTTLNLSGLAENTTWAFQHIGTWIDGSDEGPVFGGRGGPTALGGLPLRDRRDASVQRTSVRLTRTYGGWMVRPLATGYLHDFATQQSRRTGYTNYVDRQELVAGLDLGRDVATKTRAIAGFRYGRQDQFSLHGVDSPYDSRIRRFLAGIEGSPTRWLQLTLLGGQDYRSYASGTPAEFNRDKSHFWLDAMAVVSPGKADTITVSARRYLQPSFTSMSLYLDITYDVTWRHVVNGKLATTIAVRAHGGDFQTPAVREDWVLTGNVAVQYSLNRRCTLDLGYALDRAESRVPFTPGREFRRHALTLGTKYTF